MKHLWNFEIKVLKEVCDEFKILVSLPTIKSCRQQKGVFFSQKRESNLPEVRFV